MRPHALNVFFYVQHLVGVGHVFRAMRVAHALKNRGHRVHVAWGGEPVPNINTAGLKMIYLDPVHIENDDFSRLIKSNGAVMSDHEKILRRECLLKAFLQSEAHVLVTEAFPFGRRHMGFELDPLLDLAHSRGASRPLVVSSIRDIMQENRKPQRVAESHRRFDSYYDMLMVHGDPNFVPIEVTLQGVERIMDKVCYTGIVAADPPPIKVSKKRNLLISTGSGALGKKLLECAIEAMPLSKKYPTGWAVSAGLSLPDADYRNLASRVPAGMELVRFFPNLLIELACSEASVSLAGYNTVGDVLISGCKALLIPHVGKRETEQLRRAQLLQREGVAHMLSMDRLTPKSLASAVDLLAEAPLRDIYPDLNGARGAAVLLEESFLQFQSRTQIQAHGKPLTNLRV